MYPFGPKKLGNPVFGIAPRVAVAVVREQSRATFLLVGIVFHMSKKTCSMSSESPEEVVRELERHGVRRVLLLTQRTTAATAPPWRCTARRCASHWPETGFVVSGVDGHQHQVDAVACDQIATRDLRRAVRVGLAVLRDDLDVPCLAGDREAVSLSLIAPIT